MRRINFRKCPNINESIRYTKNIIETLGYPTASNHILFSPDGERWEEIKNMQYGHYIHQQLEMFNFVNADKKQE